ncbi:MAG: hypothetical protein Fur0010_21630 [Bdellovibrio sp.]
MTKQQKLISISIAVIVSFFLAAALIYKKNLENESRDLAKAQQELFVPSYSMTNGPDNAKVTLVEFLDPECESCRAFFPFVKMILNEYKDNIRLVIRYMPYHSNSRFAIKILEAARKQNKYWSAMEVLFFYQPQWGDHHNPKPELIWNFLPEVGIDVEQIKRDMNDPSFEQIIEKDKSDGEKLGVRGTPSFFINGKPLRQFSFEQLKLQIEEELNN